jgi:hypothetical protein
MLVAAFQAAPNGALGARVARDAVLMTAEKEIIVRVSEPGSHRVEWPCEYAEGEKERLTLNIALSKPEDAEVATGGTEAGSAQSAGRQDWQLTVVGPEEILEAMDMPADETDREIWRDFDLPCTHAEGEEHELKVVLRAFPEVDLLVGEHRVKAEVMDTPMKRSWGLQGRAGLPEDYGMWFIYDRPVNAVFVMKTVSFPISIAFVRADGTITNIEHLNPGDLRRALSTEKVQYVLEMERGWFKEHEVGPGSVVKWPGAEGKPAGDEIVPDE